MASYQGHNLALGDSDVESEEEYATVGQQEEEKEENKLMVSFINAIKNG